MKVRSVRSRLSALLLSGSLIAGSLTPLFSFSAKAEALPELLAGDVSLADCVMSICTSAGYYLTNTDWINELYGNFGVDAGYSINTLFQNGLITIDEFGHYVSSGLDEAISLEEAYTSLGLDTLFNVSPAEAAAGGGVAATGAGTLAGMMGGVASTGVLPLLFGVTGAYWGGIGLGTLAAHALGLYEKNIAYDIPVESAYDQIKNDIVLGNSLARGTRQANANVNPIYYVVTGSGYGVAYKVGNFTYIGTISNYNGSASSGTYYQGSPNGFNSWTNSGFVSFANDQYGYYASAPNMFDSYSDYTNWLESWKNGQITPKKYAPYSSDIIGPNGNYSVGEDAQGNILPPNFTPQLNPQTGSVNPAGNSLSDWLNFAAQAKSNTVGGSIGDNGDVYEDAKNRIITPNPTPNPNPGTNPNPNPNPNPEPVPSPDYDVDQPDQPEYDPKDPQSPEDVTTGSPWTTPNLLDKFPFCIPNDIVKVFKKLDSGDRIAPHITWRFNPPNTPVDYTFDVDFADFDTVASILRMLELMAFVVALAVATRSLIGAGG